MKLGKLAAVKDERDLLFKNFVKATKLPTPPESFSHSTFYTDWGMLGNDQYGDCVLAGAAHETMLWNKLGTHEVTMSTSYVLADYSAVTGFDPNDPATDQGTLTRTALNYRRRKGVQDASGNRHKIGAYVSLTAGNWNELMQATYIFGAVGMGFLFPASAMDQFNAHKSWDVVEGSPIEGGHYVPVVGRSVSSVGDCITWGAAQGFTQAFYEKYSDEAYAIISLEELNSSGLNERGFDITALKSALHAI